MSAVPLRKLNGKPTAARVVSVLGATGSIGDSTMDLIRRGGDRYREPAARWRECRLLLAFRRCR